MICRWRTPFDPKSEGIEATIVAGQTVYRNGKSTGNYPGRLIRGLGNPADGKIRMVG